MSLSPDRYTRTAIALHWLIAGLIVCAFALGMVMTDLAMSPQKLKFFAWHKWLGITVLGLSAIRAAWRLLHAAPTPVAMPAWQRQASTFTHLFLYALLFLVPLSGWTYSSASGYPVVYLGLVQLPDLVAKDKVLAESLMELHETLAWLLCALFVVHVAAALKHHLIDRDDTLRRMLPWRSSRGSTENAV